DLAGLPIQATQRSGRAPGALGVVAVWTVQETLQKDARVPMAGQTFLFPKRLRVTGNVEQRATESSSSRDKHLGFIHHRVGCVDADRLASRRAPQFLAIDSVDDRQCPGRVDSQKGLLPDLKRHRCRMSTGACARLPERLASLAVQSHASRAAV